MSFFFSADPSSRFTLVRRRIFLPSFVRFPFASLLFVTLFLGGLFLPEGVRADVSTGLFGYWNFDEGTGTTAADSSGNGRTGTLVDGPTWGAGVMGGAVVLDGNNDRVQGMGAAPFEYTGGNMSFSVWYYSDSTDSDNSPIVTKMWNGSGGTNYQLWEVVSTNQIALTLGGATSQTFYSSRKATLNAWNHIVVTLSSSRAVKVYLNEDLAISTTTTITNWTPAAGNNNLSLLFGGGYPYSPGLATNTATHMKGRLDEIRFYNRVLPLGDILAMSDLVPTDTTPPGAAPSISAEPLSPTSILLSWSIPADDYDIGSFKVYRDGSEIASLDASQPYYTDTGLTADMSYSYTVIAYDIGGNTSPASSAVSMRTFHDFTLPANLKAHWDFNASRMNVASDVSGNGYQGILMDGATWGTGKQGGALSLDGQNDRAQFFGSSPNPNVFEYTGGNMSISLWYYADSGDSDGGNIISKPWNGSGGYNYKIGVLSNRRIQLRLEGATVENFTVPSMNALRPDEWNHIVVTVSTASAVKMYVNDSLAISSTHSISSWTPVGGNQNVSLVFGGTYPYDPGTTNSTSAYVKGKIDNVRFYDGVLSVTDIDQVYSIENREADSPAVFFTSVPIAESTVSGAVSLSSEVVGDVDNIQFKAGPNNLGSADESRPYALGWDSSSVLNGRYIFTAVASYGSGQSVSSTDHPAFVANGDGVIVHTVPAISGTKILPNTVDLPGNPSETLSATVARGEFEPVSFLVRPGGGGLSNFNISVSSLLNGPASIPASAVDVKAVKVWYQAPTAWYETGQISGNKTPTLIPELLLNDDGLVTVDTGTGKNRIKKSGGGYVDDAYTNTPASHPNSLTCSFSDCAIEDAGTFQPIASLTANEPKQFWLTIRVPDDAVAGTYTGTVTLSADGTPLRTLTLSVRVPNFDLAATPIESNIFYRGQLNPGSAGIGSEYKTEEQYRAELTDLKNHGVRWPTIFAAQNSAGFEQELSIRRELGMNGGPLYTLGGYPGAAQQVNPDDINSLITPLLALSAQYGFTDTYIYGADEATGAALTAQRPVWQRIRDLGGKVFVAGYDDGFGLVGDLLDIQVHHDSTTTSTNFFDASQWHGVGHKIYSYSNPQVAPENPFLYRQNYGAVLWAEDYDGAMDYAYQHAFGYIWNDFDTDDYREHVFAYPIPLHTNHSV